MKLQVHSSNFEVADKLQKFIEKKTRRYEKMLSSNTAEMEIRLSVVKPETNLNKETQIRVLGLGHDIFVKKVCDTFEEGLDQCLEVVDRQLEKIKNI